MVRHPALRTAVLLFLAAVPAHAQLGDDIPLGIEVVTGYRSEYIFRGFKLGSEVLDVQAEAEVALTNDWVLSLGGWHASGADDFRESAGFADLDYRKSTYSLGLEATYRSYSGAPLDSGLDLGANATWQATKDLSLTAGGYYDTGAQGCYAKLEGEWSHPLGESSFLKLLGGVSLLSDYYGRDGLGDFYTRLGYTYVVSQRISVTPFVGSSLQLDSDPQGGDYLFGGLWFEVNF